MKKDCFLIIHQGALGDIVLTFPILLAIKREHICNIHMMCQAQYGIIAKSLGIAEKVFPIEGALFSSVFSINPMKEMIDLLNSYRKILIFSFSDHLKKIIVSLTKDMGTQVFMVFPRPKPTIKIHILDYIRLKLKKIGLIKTDDLVLYKNKFISTKTDTKLATIIHPGAGSKRKRWDIYNFISLFYMLKKEGIRAEFIIGPAEKDLYPIIRAKLSNQEIHIIEDIKGLIKLLNYTKAFIGNDSGVTHLSAFLGIPTIAIFGPSDPVRWRPIGNLVKIVRSSTNCNPCFELRSENCKDPLCLYIKPEQVFEAYIKLIS